LDLTFLKSLRMTANITNINYLVGFFQYLVYNYDLYEGFSFICLYCSLFILKFEYINYIIFFNKGIYFN